MEPKRCLTGLLSIVLILTLVCACGKRPTTINLNLGQEDAGSVVRLYTGDSIYADTLDKNGIGSFFLSRNIVPQYAGFWHRTGYFYVYIDPGKDFGLIKTDNSFKFEGPGSGKSDYLNSSFLKDFRPDFSLDPEAFLDTLSLRYDECLTHLDSLGFDDEFNQVESSRLYYDIYLNLTMYPIRSEHPAARSASSLERLKSYIKENEEMISFDEYRQFFIAAVESFTKRSYPTSDPILRLTRILDFIDSDIEGLGLKEFLTNHFMLGYLEQYGVRGLKPFLPRYTANVRDSNLLQSFRELCEDWHKLSQGQPAPDLAYPDMDGEIISLKSLRGSYVYIDLWATWCTFCVREFPYLKELESSLRGHNIVFVGISCDGDADAWRRKVVEDKLGGIQLLAGKSQELYDAFKVKGIPRFILIDPEGRIVDANMTRPSDPKTLPFILSLPGISD